MVLENTEATGRSIADVNYLQAEIHWPHLHSINFKGSHWLSKMVSVTQCREQVDDWPNTDNSHGSSVWLVSAGYSALPLILLGTMGLSLLSIKRTPSPWADTMPYKLYYKIMAVIIIIIRVTFGFHGRMKTHVTPLPNENHSPSNNNHNIHRSQMLFSEYIQWTRGWISVTRKHNEWRAVSKGQ